MLILDWLVSIMHLLGGVLYVVAEWPARLGEWRNYSWCSPEGVPWLMWRDGLFSEAFRLASDAARCASR